MATGEEQSTYCPTETPTANEFQVVKPSMEEEIEYLTKHFDGQCKVIDTPGRFVKTVKLHPANLDIVFNFKLTESYPKTVPVIEIRSETLTEEDSFDLHGFLTNTAEANNMTSLAELVSVGLEWLQEGRINVKGKKIQTKSNEVKGKKNKSKKNKKKIVETKENEKKPPMKTAIDVVKRILWDPDLDQDDFLVGYIDRMEGLKEKYFSAFSWEDIASVDYTVLAIPKHRIQYFKYKGEIVWDKRSRLDNVFGSTGSKKTIRDFVAKAGGNAEANEDVGGVQDDEHVDSDYYDSEDYTDTDSDDDGIEVTIGGCDERELYDYDCDGNRIIPGASQTEEDGFDKYWRDKLRPNYFIALRITDEDIRRNAEEVQDYIVANEQRLEGCRIPKEALHITLCTVGLETPEQVANAVECLKEAQTELSSILSKDTKLKFVGVRNFFNRVVYGRVVDCPQEFDELVQHLKLCLNEKGIEIRDYHEFVPHATLMKVSRPVARATGNAYIAPWLYSCFNKTEFGTQAVDNIHLCEMGDDRQTDGFYKTAISLDL